jgi:hypothetical protein
MKNDLGLPEVIHTAYPSTTHLATPRPRWEPRRFRVLDIRDLAKQPLTIQEFLRRPMTRRSRYLVRVLDLDRGVCRSVYHRSMAEWYRETPLRVGVFHNSKLLELISTNWGPTLADRRGLIKFLRQFEGHDMGEFRVGVFSDDLEVITCDSLS